MPAQGDLPGVRHHTGEVAPERHAYLQPNMHSSLRPFTLKERPFRDGLPLI